MNYFPALILNKQRIIANAHMYFILFHTIKLHFLLSQNKKFLIEDISKNYLFKCI